MVLKKKEPEQPPEQQPVAPPGTVDAQYQPMDAAGATQQPGAEVTMTQEQMGQPQDQPQGAYPAQEQAPQTEQQAPEQAAAPGVPDQAGADPGHQGPGMEAQQMPAQGTMIARRQQPSLPQPPTPSPVVTIPAQPRLPSPVSDARPRRGPEDAGWVASRSSPPTVSTPASGSPGAGNPPAAASTDPLGWKEIAGSTWGDQLKTVLAAIGVLALFLQGLRLLSSGESS